MAMFIFLLLLILNKSQVFGIQFVTRDFRMVISPSTPHGTLLYRVDDIMTLSCAITADVGDVHLDWIMPRKAANSQNKVDRIHARNKLTIVMRNMQESDSGEYRCSAASNANPDLLHERAIRVNVKQRKRTCAEMMFQCAGVTETCIHKRFTCDGKQDCKHGDDEDDGHCGPTPCKSKLHCPDGRCIPQHWCCDPISLNCSSRNWLSCCGYPREFPDDEENAKESQRYSDVAFFQTTVYTVIGCAMAFMFIVTILVIAICRVHMRRTMMPRCPAANTRAVENCRPASNLNSLPFYDLDVLFNRPVNPMLVTYNINNGVQFMGRPVDPPPYCEIVASPPREGPPPPYASHENLVTVPDQESEEPHESDSLLAGTSEPPISVISSNNIEGDDTTSTFVVNLTESEPGGSPMLTVVETQMVAASSQPIINEESTP